MAKTSNNNDAWHVKARNKLADLLRQSAFSQSVGEQLVNAVVASNGFLPMDYQPAKKLLTAANNSILARTYLGREVTASSVRLLNEVLHFPARAWAHCAHPVIRMAFVPVDGTADDDVRRLTAADDVRWTMPDYIAPVHVVMKTVCKGTGKHERETGQLQITPHGGIKAVDLHDQLVSHVALSGTQAVPGLDDTVLLAFVVNGQRGEDDVGRVKFLNLTRCVTAYAGTKLMKDGGRAIAIAALADDHELWMTPTECAAWLVKRYAMAFPGTTYEAMTTVQRLANTEDALGVHQLSCAGSGRLALRPMHLDKVTGERVHGFLPADYCITENGLFLRDTVQTDCDDVVTAVRQLTTVNEQLTTNVHSALVNLGLAISQFTYCSPVVNLTVDPFVSAYNNVLRMHPAGYVNAAELIASIYANRLPRVANVRVIVNVQNAPPVMVNDVDWPDCGPWTVIDR